MCEMFPCSSSYHFGGAFDTKPGVPKALASVSACAVIPSGASTRPFGVEAPLAGLIGAPSDGSYFDTVQYCA